MGGGAGTGWRWVVVHRERRTRGPWEGCVWEGLALPVPSRPQGASRPRQPPISLDISTQGPRSFCFLGEVSLRLRLPAVAHPEPSRTWHPASPQPWGPNQAGSCSWTLAPTHWCFFDAHWAAFLVSFGGQVTEAMASSFLPSSSGTEADLSVSPRQPHSPARLSKPQH